MLKVDKICHEYDGKPLLNQLSFELQDHEVLCLLGPSGSGKSTLLRIIAGLEKPMSGSVLWNDRDLADQPVYRRNFALMFQDYALFPHLNVSENVAFGLEMKKWKKAEISKRVGEVLNLVGMRGFEERHVTELSGGEQQRVALARSLAVRPELLLLDEPLGALDYNLRQTLVEELREIFTRTGISAIYVTHDQEEGFGIADKVGILHGGRLIQEGKPETIFTDPKSVWTARFLGMNNILPVERMADGSLFCADPPLTLDSPRGMPEEGQREVSLLFRNGVLEMEPAENKITLSGVVTANVCHENHFLVHVRINEAVKFSVISPVTWTTGQTVYICYMLDDIQILSI